MIHICKELQFSDKLHCIHNDLSDVKKIVDIQLFQHPLLLYITFKAITDQYSKTIGIRESIMDAIHCRSYKDLVPLYNMSFVFNCPNTKEGFYNACKAITRVVQLVQMNSVEGEAYNNLQCIRAIIITANIMVCLINLSVTGQL